MGDCNIDTTKSTLPGGSHEDQQETQNLFPDTQPFPSRDDCVPPSQPDVGFMLTDCPPLEDLEEPTEATIPKDKGNEKPTKAKQGLSKFWIIFW